MYQFTEELRKQYESVTIPFACYQVQEEKLLALLVSKSLCELMGLERKLLISRLTHNGLELIHPEDAEGVDKALQAFIRKERPYNQIYRMRNVNSNVYRYVHSFATWQNMPDGTELVCILYLDINTCMNESNLLTEDGTLLQKDLFYTDTLTGLPNLNYLNRHGNEAVDALRKQGQVPVLMYTDVKAMQYYNSQYGYDEGNRLLHLIAVVLQESFPKARLFRGTEDHFILIDTQEAVDQIDQKISEANERIRKQAVGQCSGIAMGICLVQEDINAIMALNFARAALRQIGNNRNLLFKFYDPSSAQQALEQQHISNNFEKALKEGWIKVYYQRIDRTDTGKNTAFEALARWQEPGEELLSPKVFLPVLEKYHLLHKLDLYMAEQVCREMVLRKSGGLPLLPVTVNFSAQDFDYEDIPARLEEIYDRHCRDLQLDQKYLIVEITERDVAKAGDNFYAQIQALHKLGFRVWLDDFGSGYSSLSVFSRFPVDLIKFDMEFLQNLDKDNGANRLIMNAMVQIARELGIHTLAEGLENQQQAAFLREIGCELAQGWFRDNRPQPLEKSIQAIRDGETPPPFETPDERVQMNRKWLTENEHSLALTKHLGDYLPIGLLLCKADRSGDILFANKESWRIFGCDSLEDFQSFTGSKLYQLIDPEDQARAFATIYACTEGIQGGEKLECRVLRKDGETRWIDAFTHFRHSELHEDVYYIFFSDTTETRQRSDAEKEMRKSVIDTLTRAYDSVWISEDLEAECFELFRVDAETAQIPAYKAVKLEKLSEALKFYSRLVVSEDRPAFLEAVTLENIKENTKDRAIYSVLFRRSFPEGPRYYRLEFNRMDLKDGSIYIVAGFKNVDDEMQAQMKAQQEIRNNSAIIEALSKAFDSVWLITDLQTQRFELIRVHEKKQHARHARQALQFQRFTEALEFYAERILPEDRQHFLTALSPEMIAKNTQEKVIYSVSFRRLQDDEIRNYRMDLTRLVLENGAVYIVAGIRDEEDSVYVCHREEACLQASTLQCTPPEQMDQTDLIGKTE